MPTRLSRETLILILGISLPVLVVAFFVLATTLPGLLVDPPQYDLVFSSSTSLYPHSPGGGKAFDVAFTVVDGDLQARVVEKTHPSQLTTRLFIYDKTSGSTREIQLPLPDAGHPPDTGVEIEIRELAERTFITTRKAPDGYQFRDPQSRGLGILGELFGMRGRNRYTIAKSGVVIPLQVPPGHYGLNFLGWTSESTER